jgi:hypothetical protein
MGGALRSASLAKGGTSRKRPSVHLHKVPTQSNKVSPQTLQTALVQWYGFTQLWDKVILLLFSLKNVDGGDILDSQTKKST